MRGGETGRYSDRLAERNPRVLVVAEVRLGAAELHPGPRTVGCQLDELLGGLECALTIVGEALLGRLDPGTLRLRSVRGVARRALEVGRERFHGRRHERGSQ